MQGLHKSKHQVLLSTVSIKEEKRDCTVHCACVSKWGAGRKAKECEEILLWPQPESAGHSTRNENATKKDLMLSKIYLSSLRVKNSFTCSLLAQNYLVTVQSSHQPFRNILLSRKRQDGNSKEAFLLLQAQVLPCSLPCYLLTGSNPHDVNWWER